MKLILEGKFILEKFPGKGGWIYVKFPGELIVTGQSFVMMKVSGAIDHYTFEGKFLQFMGNGFVFLPVAKPIRKAIGKEVGDEVDIKFYREEIPDKIPQELIECLDDDPGKLDLFNKLSVADQKQWIFYIYSVDDPDVKSSRIIKLLDSLIA